MNNVFLKKKTTVSTTIISTVIAARSAAITKSYRAAGPIA